MSSESNSGRLFFLDLGAGRILSLNPDGSDLKTIVSEGRKMPDGLVVDEAAGHLYWTNMGNFKENDGSIFRSDLDGRNITTIVPPGGTFTPKQIQIDKRNGKLYWCDREGMRVMRANLDGSSIETLVDTSGGDPRPGPDLRKWCVGIAVDAAGGKFYWTQKGSDNAGDGRFSARILRFRTVRPRQIGGTSNCFTTTCRSRSISISMSQTGSCTGPIGAIRRAATPSTALRWTRRRLIANTPKSSSLT
jgi:DNA-binding beta-propeller fold protein YncE